MERIDKLIKLKNEIAITRGFPSWEEMENFIIDANSSQPVNIAVLLVGAMDELADTLINGKSVDGIADMYKRDYTGVATNLDGISESLCKSEKCDAPNCYEGHEPKGCLMEGAHKPVVDVQKMAEEYAEKQDPTRMSDLDWGYTHADLIEAVKYGSTLSQSWVSVEDRLPNIGERVHLIVNSLNEQYVCIGKRKEDGFYYKDKGTLSKPMESITHWMPLPSLPSPPKEKICSTIN